MQVVGQLNVWVKYGSQEEKVVLVVVGGNGPSLSAGIGSNTSDWIGER